jgi:hypothetical protein
MDKPNATAGRANGQLLSCVVALVVGFILGWGLTLLLLLVATIAIVPVALVAAVALRSSWRWAAMGVVADSTLIWLWAVV